MFYNVLLAWAMPVDPVILCAQMEAYAETKAFYSCVQYAAFEKTLGQLPAEVIDIIGGHVQHSAFLVHEKIWQSEMECWHGLCCPSKHIDKNEYLRLKHNYIKSFETFGLHMFGGVQEYGFYRSQEFDAALFEKHLKLQGVGEFDHRKQVEKFEAKSQYLDKRFNAAHKVFFDDFGLGIHFVLYRGPFAPPKNSGIYEKNLLAYIILRSAKTNAFPTTNTATFHSLMVVDSPAMEDLTQKQISAFKRAKRMLSLAPPTEPVPLQYRYPATHVEESTARPKQLKKTKAGLRNSFQERKVDFNAIQWPQFMALAYGGDWAAKRPFL